MTPGPTVIAGRAGSAHYYQPGRPSPTVLLNRQLERASSRPRTASRPRPWARESTPETPPAADADDGGGRRLPEPHGAALLKPTPPGAAEPPDGSVLLSALTLQPQRPGAAHRASNGKRLRHLKKLYHERLLEASPTGSLGPFARPLNAADFVDAAAASSSFKAGLGEPAAARAGNKFEVDLLERLQGLKRDASEHPETPSRLRVSECLAILDGVIAKSPATVAAFLRFSQHEIRHAIFSPARADCPGDLGDDGLPDFPHLTFFERLRDTEERLAAAEHANRRLAAELEAERRVVDELRPKLADTSLASGDFSAELDKLKEENAALRDTADRLKHQNEFLNTQIDDILGTLKRTQLDLQESSGVACTTARELIHESDKELLSILSMNNPVPASAVRSPRCPSTFSISPMSPVQLSPSKKGRVTKFALTDDVKKKDPAKPQGPQQLQQGGARLSNIASPAAPSDRFSVEDGAGRRPTNLSDDQRLSDSTFHASMVSVMWTGDL
ncbi:hypothetical protein DIPPA_24360 [Diplonema papillatum]|nr:hypothetical protein DIPPA_24360 [Diplonema papillatum]|eukprot:gene16674-25588_t